MTMAKTLIAAITTVFVWQSPATAEGNSERGESIFKKCRACHQVGITAKNAAGPILNDVIGRRPGAIDQFNYSDASKEAGAKGLVWTEEQLFSFLENPAAFMPKTRMAFPGLKEGQDRRDVIEYLKKFTMQ